MFVVAFNSTDGPLTVDDAGRSIGGGEFGAVDDASPIVTEAAARGDLQLYPNLDAGPGQDAGAVDAIGHAADLENRRQALAALSDDQVASLASDAGLADATPEQLHALLAADLTVDVPALVDVASAAQPENDAAEAAPTKPRAARPRRS
jgi:hypothetical protein